MKYIKLTGLIFIMLLLFVGAYPQTIFAGDWMHEDNNFTIKIKNNDKDSSINIESAKDGHEILVTTEGEGLEVTTDTVASLAETAGSVANSGARVLGAVLWFALFAGIIALGLFVFWLAMLIHSIVNPIPNKIIWIIVNVVFGLLGSIVYFFAVKQRGK